MSKGDVNIVKDLEKEKILYLVNSQKYFPYHYLRNIEREKFVNFLMSNVQSDINKESTTLFIYESQQKIRGLLLLQHLDWDSKIFGFPCARIKYLMSDEADDNSYIKSALLKSTLEYAKKKNVQFIDIHLEPLDIEGIKVVSNQGFFLIATHNHHVWDFRTNFTLNRTPQTCIRVATIKDLPEMQTQIELLIPKHNRFFLDNMLRKTNKIEMFFQEWLKNSLLGRAELFIVAEEENRIIGYTTIVVDREARETLGVTIGSVELTGVTPFCRNKGVCLDMIAYSINWAISNHLDILEGVTHVSNAPANIVPSTLQARILGAHHTFHWHND